MHCWNQDQVYFTKSALINIFGNIMNISSQFYPARALRVLGLLLADGVPIVGLVKTF